MIIRFFILFILAIHGLLAPPTKLGPVSLFKKNYLKELNNNIIKITIGSSNICGGMSV